MMEPQLHDEGVVWALDTTSALNPQQMQLLLSVLPKHERAEVMAFQQAAHQMQALASRVAQRCAVASVFGVPQLSQVNICRTRGRKPYHGMGINPDWAPNFNYNVAHEGRFTVLASSHHLLIGVDVAAPASVRHPAAHPYDYLQRFRSCLAPSECALIADARYDVPRQHRTFQKLWSLKEAFVKARGDGLGFSPLSRACFQLADTCDMQQGAWQRTQLQLDGVCQHRWSADVCLAPHEHVVSVVRGPPSAAVDAWGGFLATFRIRELQEEELTERLMRPPPSLTMTTIPDILMAARAHDLAHNYLQLASCTV